jgi:hypothetical protein
VKAGEAEDIVEGDIEDEEFTDLDASELSSGEPDDEEDSR